MNVQEERLRVILPVRRRYWDAVIDIADREHRSNPRDQAAYLLEQAVALVVLGRWLPPTAEEMAGVGEPLAAA